MSCVVDDASEFNEDASVDWHVLNWEPNQGVQRWMKALLHRVKQEPALHEEESSWDGFEWINPQDWQNSIVSWVRYARDKSDFVVAIHNFTPVVRYGYCLGVPSGGRYRELLNSDAREYWGSGVSNGEEIVARAEPWSTFSHQLQLTLPPLATLILKPVREDDPGES